LTIECTKGTNKKKSLLNIRKYQSDFILTNIELVIFKKEIQLFNRF